MEGRRVFVGFGFGAIQGGLFLCEAFRSGNFDRLVVAEVMPEVVKALRDANGTFHVNIAGLDGIQSQAVRGMEAYNPNDPDDRARLVAALADADEIATALPSVEFYDRGTASVARLLAESFGKREKPGVVYAAENHNHAAELLEEATRIRQPGIRVPVQFLNTVIGKMSGVVVDKAEITAQGLAPITENLPRAFLVESFNRILITRTTLPGFKRGLDVFEEKPDLLPFEEAKLYGHNATHALLGYLANERNLRFMSDIVEERDLLELGREAFLRESGAALIHRHGGLDPLFTETGFRTYADDLLERMMNPHLRDAVDRIIRDHRRKLGWNDRLIGTMRLALDAGIAPTRFARGAAAAVHLLAAEQPEHDPAELLDAVWGLGAKDLKRQNEIKQLIRRVPT